MVGGKEKKPHKWGSALHRGHWAGGTISVLQKEMALFRESQYEEERASDVKIGFFSPTCEKLFMLLSRSIYDTAFPSEVKRRLREGKRGDNLIFAGNLSHNSRSGSCLFFPQSFCGIHSGEFFVPVFCPLTPFWFLWLSRKTLWSLFPFQNHLIPG